MTEVMISLGEYRFALANAAPQQLRRASEYAWPAQGRIGREPARQFVGPGNETVELEGVIYPHFRGGLGQVEAMRAEANKGEPLMLSDGLGNVYGKWVIERIEETRSALFADGAPRKIEFRLSLARYGEDA